MTVRVYLCLLHDPDPPYDEWQVGFGRSVVLELEGMDAPPLHVLLLPASADRVGIRAVWDAADGQQVQVERYISRQLVDHAAIPVAGYVARTLLRAMEQR